jgi:pimeloyl-ACP methyl ester carboxylesterase
MDRMDLDWRRLRLDDVEIEYRDQGGDQGAGLVILLVHGGVFSDSFLPLAGDPALAGFRRILIRRSGYELAPPLHQLTLADHARHCAELLRALGTGPAHVCGHSLGALVSLQLALDSPSTVNSLVLLEPAPGGELASPDDLAAIGALLGPAFAAAAEGDLETAFDTFLTGVGRPDHAQVIEAALGAQGYQRAVAQTGSLVQEAQAVASWRFSAEQARQITQPTLLVQGGRSRELARFAPQTVSRLSDMLPHAEAVVLPGVSHLMPLEDPGAVARLLAGFVARHASTQGQQAGGQAPQQR